MAFSLNHLVYCLAKPLHSSRHARLKKAASAYAAKHGLYEKAIRELSEYTREDRATIERKNKQLTAAVSSKDYDALSEQELKRFYAQTRHYLYELPLWNASSARGYSLARVVAPYLKKRKYKSVLEFGAGTGELCMELSGRGFSVRYTDINPLLVNFARWRFTKRKLSIPIIPGDKLSGYTFDCIVSFDVFEHLKNLPESFGFFRRILKSGGGLVFNIEFSGDGLHLKENKVYTDARLLDAALEKAGFVFDWRFKQFFFYRRK